MKFSPAVFDCEVCQKSFSKPSLLLRHSAVHNKAAAQFSCSRCSRYFSQNVTLQKHLKNSVCERKNHGKILLRQLVKQSTSSIQENLNNVKSVHAVKSRNNVCEYCDRSFLKPSDMERHIRTHTNERTFNCTKADCGKSFKLKDTRDRHEATHERKTFTCTNCSSNYKSHKTLQNHMRQHSRRQSYQVLGNDNESPQLRQSCNDLFGEQANGKITDNKSSLLSDLLCDTSESSSPPHNSSAMEINHVEIGNEEIVGAMDEIDEPPGGFVSLKNLSLRKTLVCEACGKSFKKPIDLRRHSDAVHQKKRPYKCNAAECNKSFSLKCTLNRHEATHAEDRKLVACNLCSKQLSSKSSLSLHQRIHGNLKPHKCQECSSTFRTSGNLKSHLKTHMKGTKSALSLRSNFMVS